MATNDTPDPDLVVNDTSTSAAATNDTPAVAANNTSAIVIGILISLGLLVLMSGLIIVVTVYCIKKNRMSAPVAANKELSGKR